MFQVIIYIIQMKIMSKPTFAYHCGCHISNAMMTERNVRNSF